ncbi:MAG: filamentous hemagglutinin N-terminal domain-containing protein [Nostocaceae cyanobacterium]|nr:filamentous hemagglutinin N-terminal domain-containing protein [Nostocaceae cyanobacterium]
MKLVASQRLLPSSLVFGCLATANHAFAQIVPDNTLPTNSRVTSGCVVCDIGGGTIKGLNLFHSFQHFSVPTGGAARFNNGLEIQNIFTRVTGNSISNIDGLIRANGDANFFFFNPNGIIFGENARLDIGGSFLGTTASNVQFADGSFFSATNPQDKPLLTINVPIGLGFTNNPGRIYVEGTGHKMSADSLFVPIFNSSTNSQLQVQTGKTLALVGGDITLNGATLKAESGQLELGSLRGAGTVNLQGNINSFKLDYNQTNNLGNISFEQRSLADASGFNAGSIQIQGNQVTLNNGSLIIVKNQGLQKAGDININAIELLKLDNNTNNSEFNTTILSETISPGDSSNINIKTKNLIVRDGGAINSKTFSIANGGEININVTELFEVSGYSAIDPNRISTVSAGTLMPKTSGFTSGKAGDVNILTKQLLVSKNGTLSTSNFGNGLGGNLTINAETIDIIGSDAISIASSISATNLGTGSAGSINIDTNTLSLENGGIVTTESFDSGSAGNITINASEFIDVSGTTPVFVSEITSAVKTPIPLLQQRFGLDAIVSGDSGNIIINTPTLKISNRGTVSVKNDGMGNAGNIKINANSLFLDNQSSLTAATASGEGGNIFFQGQNLLMRRNSNITTTAVGDGNGGNITIDTDILAALENSDITANAQASFGGIVVIDATAIIGTQFSQELTLDSNITATSSLGSEFNGVVDITTLSVKPTSGLVKLPETLVNSSNQITARCSNNNDSSFRIAGRGGLPPSPNDLLIGDRILVDLGEQPTVGGGASVSLSPAKTPANNEIVEAQGWVVDANGQIYLVADVNEVIPNSPALPQASCENLSNGKG